MTTSQLLGILKDTNKLKLFGSGLYGNVYQLQVENEENAKYLVKEVQINDDIITLREIKEEFLYGLKKSRNLVKYYGSFLEEKTGKFYFSMSLYSSNLTDFVNDTRKKGVSEQEFITLFGDITTALYELNHNFKKTHRNLKPENILLRLSTKNEPRAFVTDIGLGKIFNTLKMSSRFEEEGKGRVYSLRQTKIFSDPYREDNVIEESSQLYSLGLVSIYMLYPGEFLELMNNKEDYRETDDVLGLLDSLHSKIPKQYKYFIASMLSPDKTRRPSVAELYEFISDQRSYVSIDINMQESVKTPEVDEGQQDQELTFKEYVDFIYYASGLAAKKLTVDLSMQKINEAKAFEISRKLGSFHLIQNLGLDLSFNEIEGLGCIAILKSVSLFKYLEELDLKFSNKEFDYKPGQEFDFLEQLEEKTTTHHGNVQMKLKKGTSQFDQICFDNLYKILLRSTNIRKLVLDLGFTSAIDANIKTLSKCLAGLKKIKEISLWLRGCELNDESLGNISNFLKSSPELRLLSINLGDENTFISDQSFFQLTEALEYKHRSLTNFSCVLRGPGICISGNSFKKLSCSIALITGLRSLNVEISGDLSEIDDDALIIFSTSLKKTKKLSSISLSLRGGKNRISDRGLSALSGSFSILKKISNLFLDFSAGDNQIGDEGLAAFSNGLLNLDRVKKLKLDFRGGRNEITDAGVCSLASVLRSMNKLETLTLNLGEGMNSITNKGFTELVYSIENLNLKRLRIDLGWGKNSLDDAAMLTLSKGVAKLKSISEIYFDFSSGNHAIGSQGFQALFAAVCTLPELYFIHLDFSAFWGNNSIADLALSQLPKQIPKMKSLRRLYLDFRYGKNNILIRTLNKIMNVVGEDLEANILI